jgi:hypothetical protein
MDILPYVVTAMLSGLGAAAAATLGFYVSGLQRRRDKAFDAQSAWFEEVVQLLHSQAALFESRALLADADTEGRYNKDFYSNIKSGLWELQCAMWRARMYASKPAIRALDGLAIVFHDTLAAGFGADPPVSDPHRHWKILATILRLAADRLANEYRQEMLGLSGLDGSWHDFDRLVEDSLAAGEVPPAYDIAAPDETHDNAVGARP